MSDTVKMVRVRFVPGFGVKRDGVEVPIGGVIEVRRKSVDRKKFEGFVTEDEFEKAQVVQEEARERVARRRKKSSEKEE
jgi:hypothetical protein